MVNIQRHRNIQAREGLKNVRSEPLNESGSQVAERLGSRASNLKVASLIPGHVKLQCDLGECPCTYCKSLWIRAFAK